MIDEEVKSPYELQAMEVWCPRCNAEFVTYYNSCEASLFAQLAARDQRIAELEAALREARSFINSVSTNKDALEVLSVVDNTLAGGAS